MARTRIKVLAIPDLHAPFAHRDAVDFLATVKKKQSPDMIVCLGDEADQHALADFDHDPDGYSAGAELAAAIRQLKPIYDLFPEVWVCTSNHGDRIAKRAFKNGIPRAYLRTPREYMEAPKGWNWAAEHVADGVTYCHGEGVSGPEGALKLACANQMSTVIGHLHGDAGIRYLSNRAALLYGFNAGWLGDKDAYAVAYGRHSLKRGILGAGIVNRGWPFFLPMLLDRAGRWLGPTSL